MLVGGSDGPASGFNAAIRGLFDGTGIEPEFVPTREIFPGRAGHDPGFLAISVVIDYPDEVVRVPLLPEPKLAYAFIERSDVDRSAVRAFGPFAREYLAAASAG